MRQYSIASFLEAIEAAGNSALLLRVTKDFGSAAAYLDFAAQHQTIADPADPAEDAYLELLEAWKARGVDDPRADGDVSADPRANTATSPSEASVHGAEYDYVSRLLPGGDVAPLFASETCLFCKGDRPNPRTYYGITDMGHAQPESQKTSALGFRVKTKVGSMVPLQIAACAHCRRNHLIASYLKLVTIVVLMALSLLVLTLPPISKALLSVHEGLSLLVFVAMLPISWLLSMMLTNRFIAKHSAETRFDIAEIPFVQRMIEMGWFPLYDGGSVSRLVFSKKRLSQGWFI